MDDLIQEFVAETNESLALLDQEMVKFEQAPDDADTLSRIFRVMHTIKGTCGFLGLPRLERVAHAGEDVLGQFRDGKLAVTGEAVTLILRCLDCIREIVQAIEASGTEPAGDDAALVTELRAMADGGNAVAMRTLVPLANAIGPKIDSEFGHPVAQELLDEMETAQNADPLVEAISEVVAKSVERTAAAEKGNANEKAGQTIRVAVDVLENLMTLVSEMVLTRNQLLQIARSNEENPFKGPIQRLNRVTTDLQESVMKTRMQQIGHAWNKLPRIVRDLANELGKNINLEMHGEETELDRQVLELIRDPLTHMVRNSADHGLERPEERRATAKPETGTIRLSAHHEGGHIIIQIKDDGRGLNTDKIKAKILEKALATPAELQAMDENQIHQFIMKPGFSTADRITNVSGRGVGMDVVKSNIEKIGGTVEFRSVQGVGSTFTIKIPLTLAIVSALIVEVAGQRFAIPQIAVREVVRAGIGSDSQIESLAGAPVLRLRNRLLPLVSLRSALDLVDRAEGNVVVCRSGSQTFGVIVDHIADAEEIVVKPLSEMLKGLGLYSGNTILGDGTVILILDVNALATRLATEAQDVAASDAESMGNATDTKNILLFRTRDSGLKSVPLSEVHRIENFEMDKMEWIQGRPVVQYRNKLLSITSIEGASGVKTSGRQPVLVFIEDDAMVGLAIEKIEDIVAGRIDINTATASNGFRGSQIVAGRAVDYVDPAFFLTMHGAAPQPVSKPMFVYGEAA